MSALVKSGITEEQKRQLCSVIEEASVKGCELALHLLSLDKEGLNKFFRHGDYLNAAVMRDIIFIIDLLSTRSQLDDEEVPSLFGYLAGYKQGLDGVEFLQGFRPKPVEEQIERLREIIPSLSTARANEELAWCVRPPESEAYFAIPRWQLIAPTYGEAVEKILALIDKYSPDRVFNYRAGKLGPEYLRPYEPSLVMWERLCEAQKGHDILILPAQFGIRHRGRSFRRARQVMLENEFGLGAFAVGCMLLTHPERFRDYDDLWLECSGDEYAPDADGRFIAAPLFMHGPGEIGFDVLHHIRAKIGSVSGFLPPQ
jgi:hypothetical protein